MQGQPLRRQKPIRAPKIAVYFSLGTARPGVPYLKKIAQASLPHIPAGRKLLRESKPIRLEISITSSSEIKALNRTYRGKDRATDVLAFPRLTSHYAWEADLGDILICWPVALRQAKEYQSSLRMELARLLVHGLLHLFGYDHETNAKDAKVMFALQDKILKKIDPLITRGSPQWDRLRQRAEKEKASPRKQRNQRRKK